MFSETADFYDLLYSFKDYERETETLVALMRSCSARPLESLLDVACGTGGHLASLAGRFRAEGLDLDEGMLTAARKRLPGVPLHRGDLCDFDLGRRFDAVTCLFSSIAYVGSTERLNAAVACLARHLEPGGVLAVEPWLAASEFQPGTLHVHSGRDETRAVTRLTRSRLEGRVSVLEMHYLLGDPEGVRHAQERHELTLFTDEEHRAALTGAGLLSIRKDEAGLFDRGLWLAVAPG